MFHARLFTETVNFRNHHFQPIRKGLGSKSSLDSIRQEDSHLDGNPSIDRPLFVQFCANSPDELLEAAKYVQPFCDAVDLNLGCPQGIARKGHYGAFLQEDWDTIHKLINELHLKLAVPVTAKMRILETKEKTLEYARVILSAGASIITVHGRQRDQKGHKTGLADWSVIRYLREKLPPETVIFANGNILLHEDLQTCLHETGVDGVMSAEANLYDPTIFAEPPGVGEEGREYWRGRDGKGGYRVDAVFRRYMDIIHRYVLEKELPERRPLFLPSDPVSVLEVAPKEDGGPSVENGEPPAKRHKKNSKQSTSPNLLAMQPHLFHLLRPLVSKHTDIRDALARSRAGDIAAFERVLSMVEKAVKEGMLDYERDPSKYDEISDPEPQTEKQNAEEATKDESSLAMVKACRRPWWVCQPYVRPLPKEALEKGSLTMGKKEKKQLEESTFSQINGHALKPEGKSERERVDELDGVPREEMPGTSQVCG
ncbi:tRNA-dihydrouridine(16/17) synthase [NAD(P)(+)] [Physcia stellaris]|nr:tRNA-dihydrouridine(16/17) synthase [NAD(P)(+)] [Physcia stellaris]